MNVYINDIVKILPPHFKYTSIGKVVSLKPIKCKLNSGKIVDVSNCELKLVKRDKGLFK